MNDDMLDPINEDEDADVSEGENAAEATEEAPASEIEDSEGDPGDPPAAELPPWTPSAKLLEKLGELISNRQKIEQVRNQKKASNAAYKDREDALDARIGELTEQINEETWHEAFDPENGIVTRTNRLTGEVETRPYEPSKQVEIPFVDPRLANVSPGMHSEDTGGDHRVYMLQDPDAPEINPILEHLTEQWEPVSDIATRAGLESKAAAKLLKIGIEEGQVQAEGEKRGRRYRKVS